MYSFKNPIDNRNRDIIKEIVVSHFGLDKESEEEFVNLLYDPDIDSVYGDHLDSDLRARFPIDREALEDYDIAWSEFKDLFSTYVGEFGITYKDFTRGKIVVDKNELRIFKHLVSYYLESERSISALFFDLGLHRHMRNVTSANLILNEKINGVIANRLPSKASFQAVISCNFADWFLCSTAEDWTSCLNLESDYYACYWSGLPGFIKDKNRAMVYITNGQKKVYRGMVVDKILSRSFLMLNKKDEMNFLRWYPTSSYFDSGAFKAMPFNIKSILQMDYRGEIKHKVKPLFFKSGHSCFAYQDKTAFSYEGGGEANREQKLEIVEKGGQFYLNKLVSGDFIEGGVFSYTGGLSGVIENGLIISDLTGDKCENCGTTINDETSVTSNDDGIYCEGCYSELFSRCTSCEEEQERESLIVNNWGNFCEYCYSQEFTQCSDCGEDVYLNRTIRGVNEESQTVYRCGRCNARSINVNAV